MSRKVFVLLSLLFVATAAFAQSNEAAFSRDAVGVKNYPGALRLAERAALAPAVNLSAAAEGALDEVLAIQKWNDADRLPMQNGFTRSLVQPISVRLEGAVAAKGAQAAALSRGLVSATDKGTLVWSGAIRIDKAHEARLQLTNVQVPDDVVFWVWGAGETPIAFGKELVYEGTLYTPPVKGPVVFFEIEVPSPKSAADVASFNIESVLEILAPNQLRTPKEDDVPSCLIDVNCVSDSTFSGVADASRGVAFLQYVKDGGNYLCSGGLLNDKVDGTFVPYLLTANHCFSTQASATTLVATWERKTTSCGSASTTNAGTSNGSTLLATGASTDFTLVRLNSVPANRTFFGWTTAAVGVNEKVHRISHPVPDGTIRPQQYSNTNENSVFGTCTNRPLSHYLYSTGGQGGTYGGSSGSPVLKAGSLQVVGQLLGACGTNPTAGCDNVNNATVDGRFSQTFPSIQQFINVSGGGCTETANNICLNNNRFGVKIDYATSSSSGQAGAIKYTADSGLFHFFGASNIEIILKVLNGCGLNNRYWVFMAGTTDVGYTVTVTDTQTGTVKTYSNPQGQTAATILDTGAFGTCP